MRDDKFSFMLWQMLKTSRHVGALPDALLLELLAQLVVQDLDDRALIEERGGVAQRRYAVVSGAVQLTSDSSSGRSITLCYLPPGTWLCDDAIVLDDPLQFEARACGKTTLAYLPAQSLRRLLREHPALVRVLNQLQLDRIRYLEWQHLLCSSLPLPARLAKRLLELARHFARPQRWPAQDGAEIHLPLTQADLARLLGVSRQRVNQHLCAFRDHHWIDTSRGRIALLDRAALERVGRGAGHDLPVPLSH